MTTTIQAFVNAIRLFAQIVEADLFDDRLEYDVDMLATMYRVDTPTATALYKIMHA